jgi:hypothetical protein
LKGADLPEEMPPAIGMTEQRLPEQMLLVLRPASAKREMIQPLQGWGGRMLLSVLIVNPFGVVGSATYFGRTILDGL